MPFTVRQRTYIFSNFASNMPYIRGDFKCKCAGQTESDFMIFFLVLLFSTFKRLLQYMKRMQFSGFDLGGCGGGGGRTESY